MNTTFPTCAKSFKQWYNSNQIYKNFYNKKLKKLSLFDTTLRDGLQGLPLKDQLQFKLSDKITLYNELKSKQLLHNMEIGSLVSSKLLPIFSDSLQLFNYIHNNQYIKNVFYNNFILIPNKNKLNLIINNPLINNLSFITSVSNSFQLKNTNMSLKQSDQELYEILIDLDNHPLRPNKAFIKLYISCINDCPIEGKIDNDFIVYRILQLNKLNIDYICLSDTRGTLDVEDFEYIIDSCRVFGLPMSKLSLHLHVNPNRINMVQNIIYMALDKNIFMFDVSQIQTGGCSVTINKNDIRPNLSYDLYYETICKYIMKKTNA